MSSLRGRPYKRGIIYIDLVAELVPYTVRTQADEDGDESPCQEWANYNEALEHLAPKSGFKDVEDWVDALRPRHHEKHFLYHLFLACRSGRFKE